MFSSSFFMAYHRWNALLCVPMGFFLNFLLLWLILRRTPKDMWVHSRVLLQTCILDILMLIVLAMGGHMMAGIQSQYNLVMFQGYFLDLYQKFWGTWQQNGLQLLMQLSFDIYHLDTQSISVQFIYRYLVLNHGIKIGIGRYLLFLLPALLFNLALYGTLPFMFNRDEDFASLEKDLLISHGIMELGQKPPYYVVYQQKDSFSKLWGTLFVLSQTFFYAIILFCGIRMVRFVSAHAMTERLKELNRQLSRNLIILATYPLIMDMSLALFVAIFGLFSTESSLSLDLQLLMSPLINWFSVFNPLISIWTFKPYRKTILKAICFCNFKIAPALN